jgi:hypothetical protein
MQSRSIEQVIINSISNEQCRYGYKRGWRENFFESGLVADPMHIFVPYCSLSFKTPQMALRGQHLTI